MNDAHDQLPELLRPARVEVDLDALGHNLALLKSRVEPARILAVVKADAYGHGAPAVSGYLERAGVDWLGVALVEEGVELRRRGITSPILVLGTSGAEQPALYGRYGLTPTVSSLEQLELWSRFATEAGSLRSLHLKVDTGMVRLGVMPEEFPQALELVRRHPHLELAGVLSHLADANEPESPRTGEQTVRFDALLELLTAEERGRVLVHLTNSAGALHHPPTRLDLVRLGLSLYGLDPARRDAGLRPVMSVVSRVVQVKKIAVGARVGYGGIWRADRESLVAIVPVGYADGYGRRLSNRAQVLVRGRRAPVVGAVSMDMCAVDVTDTGAEGGDEVILLGRQGEETIGAWDLAEQAGTIPYEVLCLLGLRLPRSYRLGGVEVGLDSRFTPISG